MNLATSIDELKRELADFDCRPATLVPDLVMIALATDVLESAIAAQHTVQSPLPHKAYANARLAFDGAQQLLVLSTHEEYEHAGALAWVYFESKDADWRTEFERQRVKGAETLSDEEWLDRRVKQMAAVWDSAAHGRGQLLLNALGAARQSAKKKPDNWLHENMAARQHRAYSLFAAQTGGKTAETEELNKNMYRVLCREAHARPRLDSFGVIHDRVRATVRIDILPRDLERARRVVAASTQLAVEETSLSLRWQRTGAV